MFRPSRIQLLAFALPLLFAGSLFAQRYQDRDHTVFHRPAPATTGQRHQSSSSGASALPHRSAPTSTTAHAHQTQLGGAQPANETHNPPTLQVPQSR